MKKRKFKDKNYSAIFFNNKVLRSKINPILDVKELDWPEFYDVKINNKCYGKCPYCYQSSAPDEDNYKNIIQKAEMFFGQMDKNQLPFQIAIGGGEPTLHPDFIPFLEYIRSLGIVPNYTSNGMFIDQDNYLDIIQASQDLCGGVAISTHPHLDKIWAMAARILCLYEIPVNLHCIISDEESINRFIDIYNDMRTIIKYFVLLPYEGVGRATPKKISFDYLFHKIQNEIFDIDQISYGANFYTELKKHTWLDISLYEPEMFSKFLDLKDMKIYKSSFDLTPVTIGG